MNLQIASDLHIEFYQGDAWDWDEIALIVPAAPVIALLGDIGVCSSRKGQIQYESFIKWCRSKFEIVLAISGNHEYYNPPRGHTEVHEVDEFIENLTVNDATLGDFYYLKNKSIAINGVKVVGTTLWTEFPNDLAMEMVEGFLNDYAVIYFQGKRLTASTTFQWHKENLAWLKHELVTDMPVVILTHHTPSLRGTSNPIYENRPVPESYLNFGFSSNLDYLFEGEVLVLSLDIT